MRKILAIVGSAVSHAYTVDIWTQTRTAGSAWVPRTPSARCARSLCFCYDLQALKHFDIVVRGQDTAKKQLMLPTIMYVADYCTHAAAKNARMCILQGKLEARVLTVMILHLFLRPREVASCFSSVACAWSCDNGHSARASCKWKQNATRSFYSSKQRSFSLPCNHPLLTALNTLTCMTNDIHRSLSWTSFLVQLQIFQ